MPFYVFGKNLNHVLSAPDAVWCWDGTDNEWLPIEWEYGPNSKTLLVGVDPDCIGSNSAMAPPGGMPRMGVVDGLSAG
jgi:hypothetical protein